MVPRESEDNAYANFWGEGQRALLYVPADLGLMSGKSW